MAVSTLANMVASSLVGKMRHPSISIKTQGNMTGNFTGAMKSLKAMRAFFLNQIMKAAKMPQIFCKPKWQTSKRSNRSSNISNNNNSFKSNKLNNKLNYKLSNKLNYKLNFKLNNKHNISNL